MNAATLNTGGSDTFEICLDIPRRPPSGRPALDGATMSFSSDEARVYYAIQLT